MQIFAKVGFARGSWDSMRATLDIRTGAAKALLSRIADELRSDRTPTRNCTAPRTDRRLLNVEAFRGNSKYGGDGNRSDLAYAVYALTQGISEVVVTDAIDSRDLSKSRHELQIKVLLSDIHKHEKGVIEFSISCSTPR